jgi:predicted nucleic acid-binding protein
LLVSRLYPGDTHHADALACFRKYASATWITSAWSELETVNSLRQLCLRQPGPAMQVPEALRRLFRHWHEHGPFERAAISLDEGLRECGQLSAAHATTLRMRSADVLHVALLEQINPDLFATRDREQYDLAVKRAFRSELVP